MGAILRVGTDVAATCRVDRVFRLIIKWKLLQDDMNNVGLIMVGFGRWIGWSQNSIISESIVANWADYFESQVSHVEGADSIPISGTEICVFFILP